MSKHRKGKTAKTQVEIGNERPDRTSTVTFSIRLTSSERELLANAAKFKGWTTTSLIKQAAIERAAHIVNLATPRSFEFESLARRLARHLCDPDIKVTHHDFPELPPVKITDLVVEENGATLGENHHVFCDGLVRPAQLRDATRLGGVEFVTRVLDECERLSANSTTLPAPIDPAKVV